MADMQRGRDDMLALGTALVSRLCHDLSGPLHGLAAALAEAGEDTEALALAQEAAAALRARLVLLRAAWGAPAALAAGGLRLLAEGLPQAHRLRLEFAGPVATAPLRPETARLLLNALLLAAESLPRGGRVTLAGDPRRQVVLTIDGPGAAWPAGLEVVPADPPAAATAGPRRMQAALLGLFAAEAGAQVRLLPGASAPTIVLDLDGAGG